MQLGEIAIERDERSIDLIANRRTASSLAPQIPAPYVGIPSNYPSPQICPSAPPPYSFPAIPPARDAPIECSNQSPSNFTVAA